MLKHVCSGLEPAVEILRAVRHGVAAGACAVEARETRSAYRAGMAEDQRGKAKTLLHPAQCPTVPLRLPVIGASRPLSSTSRASCNLRSDAWRGSARFNRQRHQVDGAIRAYFRTTR